MTVDLTEEGTSRYAQTASWKLHYNEAGEGHPVILLHGSGAGAPGWSNYQPNQRPQAAAIPEVAERQVRDFGRRIARRVQAASQAPRPARPSPDQHRSI